MTNRPRHPRPSHRRAFTLVELLVVMTIIVVLTGLITGVGIAVFRNQQGSATKNVLLSLDRALDEYIAQTSAIPPFSLSDYNQVPGPEVDLADTDFFRVYPTGGENNPRRPDAAVFIKQALTVGQAQPLVTGIGDRFLRATTGPTSATNQDIARDGTPSVVDAWANADWAEPWNPIGQTLIYYIHPQNQMAQALYGKCVNGRPYFLSAGPDRIYGLKDDILNTTLDQPTTEAGLKDNITSYPVGEAILTQDFFTSYR